MRARTRIRPPFLLAILVVGMLLPPGIASGGARPPKPLRAHKGVYIGTMISSTGKYHRDESLDRKLFRKLCAEFNMMTPGNALKFSAIHPSPKGFDFSTAERLYDQASGCGMRFIGSTLVWGEQIPSWVYRYDGDPVSVRNILKNHIITVVRHFAGRIYAWDVVNEAVDPWGNLRQNFWERNLGPGYVEDAFRWAHKADKTALLFYNETSVYAPGVRRDSVVRYLRLWRSHGAPIDGVGIQTHFGLDAPSYEILTSDLRLFASMGLQTRLSEMDVAIPGGSASWQDLQRQADVFYRTASACFSPGTNCRMLTIWGSVDRYWYPSDLSHPTCCGLLFDGDYQRKPAYTAVRDALSGA